MRVRCVGHAGKARGGQTPVIPRISARLSAAIDKAIRERREVRPRLSQSPLLLRDDGKDLLDFSDVLADARNPNVEVLRKVFNGGAFGNLALELEALDYKKVNDRFVNESIVVNRDDSVRERSRARIPEISEKQDVRPTFRPTGLIHALESALGDPKVLKKQSRGDAGFLPSSAFFTGRSQKPLYESSNENTGKAEHSSYPIHTDDSDMLERAPT